jgi:hypothetical protein
MVDSIALLEQGVTAPLRGLWDEGNWVEEDLLCGFLFDN